MEAKAELELLEKFSRYEKRFRAMEEVSRVLGAAPDAENKNKLHNLIAGFGELLEEREETETLLETLLGWIGEFRHIAGGRFHLRSVPFLSANLIQTTSGIGVGQASFLAFRCGRLFTHIQLMFITIS